MLTATIVSFRIQRLAKSLTQISDQVLTRQLGIGLAQLRILIVIDQGQQLTQQQIALALDQTEASISRQIKILQGSGLLVTQLSPKDRRQHLTRLTPQGRRHLDKALSVLQDQLRPYFDDFSEQRQTALISVIEQLEYRLKNG